MCTKQHHQDQTYHQVVQINLTKPQITNSLEALRPNAPHMQLRYTARGQYIKEMEDHIRVSVRSSPLEQIMKSVLEVSTYF